MGSVTWITLKMKDVANLKAVVVTGNQGDRFLRQHLRKTNQPTAPLELSVLAYLPYRYTAVVVRGWRCPTVERGEGRQPCPKQAALPPTGAADLES